MLHRLIFAFSLIVTFGIAQIGAVAHEISHYSNVTAQNQQQDLNKHGQKDLAPDNQAPHNQVCEKCLGYAELGHAVQNTDVTLPIGIDNQHYLNSYSATSSYAKLRSYSARAPPTLV
jgi:hypothetical protein